LCGASKIGGAALKPAGAVREEQYIEVDVAATTLLQSNDEHIAISAFANGQPFTPKGFWNEPNAPNGGIGIALGRIDRSNCPADGYDTHVEFAIEQFGWADPTGGGSRILDCVSFNKSALTGVWKIRISVFVACVGTTCNASATVENASTFALLGSVSNTGIQLKNPTTARRPWYAVTNLAAQPFNYSASFWVRTEMYSPYF
jgi:hypothetical protein